MRKEIVIGEVKFETAEQKYALWLQVIKGVS